MICIQYNNGRVLQGVALAIGDRRVRVAVKDSDDAVELRLVNQFWVSEDCEVVRLDFSDRAALPANHQADLLETVLPARSQPDSLRRVM